MCADVLYVDHLVVWLPYKYMTCNIIYKSYSTIEKKKNKKNK